MRRETGVLGVPIKEIRERRVRGDLPKPPDSPIASLTPEQQKLSDLIKIDPLGAFPVYK